MFAGLHCCAARASRNPTRPLSLPCPQSTVPLVEVNSYERHWFLRSLAASPLFIAAFLGLFSWQVGGCSLSCICLPGFLPLRKSAWHVHVCKLCTHICTTQPYFGLLVHGALQALLRSHPAMPDPPARAVCVFPCSCPQALLVALGVGVALAGVGYVGTEQLQGKAPLWTFGTGYPIGEWGLCGSVGVGE